MLNKTLLTEQLKRFWAIAVLPAAVYLVAVYAPMVSNRDDWWAMRQMVDIITFGNFAMMLTMVITPVAAAFCVFSGFFNKAATTALYALPLNKTQLFATNALAGIILSLIPVVIFCAVLLFPLEFHENIDSVFHLRAHGTIGTTLGGTITFSPQGNIPEALLPGGPIEGAVLNTVPVIGGLFLRMALTTLFYFAVAYLAFSLAGHGIIALLVAGAIPFVPAALMLLVHLIGLAYVFGFSAATMQNIFTRFFVYHQPAMWSQLIRPDIYTRMQAVIIPYISYSVLTVAMLVGAYFVFRARKPERVGNSILFNPVKNVLIFLVSLAAMLALGVVFYAAGGESVFMLHVGFIIGFALGFVVAQMIAEKSLNILEKFRVLPRFIGVVAALYVSVLLFTQFGMGFYVNRVPEEVSGVSVSVSWFEDGIPHTDPEFIAATRAAHQIILDNIDEVREVPLINRSEWERSGGWGLPIRENIFIQYVLENGRNVIRQYTLPVEFVEEMGLTEFLTRREVVLASYSAFQAPQYLTEITLQFSFLEYDAERDRWETAHREDVTIEERGQMYIILELIAQGAVEGAKLQRETRREMRLNPHYFEAPPTPVSPAEFPVPVRTHPHISISFHVDRQLDQEVFSGGMVTWVTNHRFWRVPPIWGESVTRIYEQLYEWGLVEGVDR